MTSFTQAAKILLTLEPKQSYELVDMVEKVYPLTEIARTIDGFNNIPGYKQNVLLHWAAEELNGGIPTQL